VVICIAFVCAETTVFNHNNILTVLSVPYSSNPFCFCRHACMHACTQKVLLALNKYYDLKMEYSYD